MKNIFLLLLTISMLGFYSCTKDEDKDTTDTPAEETPAAIANFISIDGVKTELTQDVVVEEGKYFMLDGTDSIFLRKWKVWVATDQLVIGTDAFSGTFTGLYTEILSPEAEAPDAGTYVANTAGAGVIPSYTTAVFAEDYDFDAAGSTTAIEGDNDMTITVTGENTTITLKGTSNSKTIEISYTGKLNILAAKKKGREELKL